MTKTRIGKTKLGQEVYINTTWKVAGGYEGYIIGRKGYAVLVFIPAK